MKEQIGQARVARRMAGAVAGVLVLLAIGFGFARWALARQDRWMREDLLQQARLFVQTLNRTNLRMLAGNADDAARPEYRRLKAQLMAARTIDPDWRWIYLLGRATNRTVFFQMDSEAFDAPEASLPGQPYEAASAILQGVFDQGKSATEGPLADPWGTWVSAFVPVKDVRTGELQLVLGIDLDAGQWDRLRSRALRMPVFSCLALIVLWLTGHLLQATARRPGTGRSGWAPCSECVLVAGAGLILTATLIWLIDTTDSRNREISFRRMADIEAQPILTAIANLRDLEMTGFASFFESSEEIVDGEFRQYAAHLLTVPEVTFWGWIDVVSAPERAGFEGEAARQTGRPDFRIREPDAAGALRPATERERYYPLVHLANLENHNPAAGLDIGSDPERRAELEDALRTGLPAAIGPIPRLGPAAAARTLVLVRPAAHPSQPTHPEGLVIAGLDIDRWLHASRYRIPDRHPMAVIDLLELADGRSPTWLGTTAEDSETPPPADPARRAPPALVRPLLAFGKTFALVARPTPEFLRLYPATPVWLFGLVGLVLTGSVAGLLNLLATRRTSLARLVEERSGQLVRAVERFDLLARQNRIAIWEIDVAGRYVEISPVFTDILGYSAAELVGRHFYDLCPEEHRRELMEAALGSIRDGEPIRDLVHPVQAKAGRVVWALTSGIPLRDERGHLTGYWGTSSDITARRENEENLARLARENQVAVRRFEALVKASNTGAWEYDAETRRMWCSPEYFSLLGHDPRDFARPPEQRTLDALWLELIHPGDRATARQSLEGHPRDSRAPYEQRFRMRRGDGTWAWIWSRGQRLFDAAGRPTSRIVGTHIDITKDMHVEEALRESEQKYRMLTETMKDVVWIVDVETLRFIYVSPSVERLRGFTPAEVLAGTVAESLEPGQLDKLTAMLRTHAEEFRQGRITPDTFFTLELVQPRKGGEPIVTEAVVRFWQNRRTGRLELHGTTRDITERKQIETHLRFQAQLLNCVNEAVVSTDLDGRIRYWNHEAERMFGYAADEVLGRPYRRFAGALAPPDETAFRQEILAKGFWRGEHLQRRKNGETFWTASFISPVRDPENRPVGFIGIDQDITERKRTEIALRESEQKYRALFENMLEGFALHEIVCDAQDRPVDYRFLAVNPAFERMTGLKAADIVGRTATTVLPGLEQSWIDIYGNVARTGLPAFFQNFSTPLGRHFEVTAFRPEPGRFACIFNDVTERHLVLEELGESRRRYASLLANLPGMAYRCRNDRNWTMEFVSQGGQELTGYAPEDLVDNRAVSYNDLILPAYREPVWTAWQLALRERRQFEMEYEIATRAGETKWVWEQGEGVFDEHGEVLALEGFISDITERRRADAERERLIRAIEQSGETILITAADGTILYVNPAFTRVTGYAREEVVGHNPRLLASGRHDREFYREMWRTLEAGRTWEGRIVNRRKNGSLFTEQAAISPVRDGAGHIVNFVAVKRDITQQLQAEEEKAALETQLAHAQKLESVGRLAGGVAHDFNNMLQAILGYLEMAIEQVPPDQPLHADLREIHQTALRSTALTKQLQAFARRQAAAPRVLDLNQAVAGMLSMLRRLIGEGIELVWQPGPDLGPVKIDPGQLDQLVTNLCLNARDAIGQAGRITLATELARPPRADDPAPPGGLRPGAYVRLSVQDDGAGMAPEVLAHIFEPFFTTKPVGKGTGLGLSTVYGIVTQNGGDIQVDSAPGRGTTFRIYLPRHTGPVPESTPPGEEPAPAAASHETILLVEDEETILRTTRRILEHLGYRVLATPSPREAIEIADRQPGQIDLLLTDVIMSGMNGPELARHLQKRRPALRHLFMSGYTANLLAEQGVREDTADFIQKPFSRNTLARKVRDALAAKK